jgi:hypothetical protein
MSAYGMALQAYEDARDNANRLAEIERLLSKHGIKTQRVENKDRLVKSGAYPHVSINVRD